MEGTPSESPVTVNDLVSMKDTYERMGGNAELFDLRDVLMRSADASSLPPTVRKSAVLVMRGFADRILGPDAMAKIEHELESMKLNNLVDSKALMRKSVKNKHARHNNVIADFVQKPDIAAGKGTVVHFKDYPALDSMRKAAATWMKQENPLVGEQNRYFDVKDCGIGWHGDAERNIVWGLRVGKATREMPLMFNAWYQKKSIGHKTVIHFESGDVYVMSQHAVGKDWMSRSRVTWRHAAGSLTCKYSKMKHELPEKRKRVKKAKGVLTSAIHKK